MKSSRQMAFGAMITAIMGVLLAINRMSAGMVSGLLMYIYPLPMLVYSAFCGGKSSRAVFAAMLILILLMAGGPGSAVTAIGQTAVGLVYGCNVRRNVSTRTNLAVIMLVSAAVMLMQMIISVSVLGYDGTYLISLISGAVSRLLRLGVLNKTMQLICFYVFACAIGLGNGWIISVIAELLLDKLNTIRIRI